MNRTIFVFLSAKGIDLRLGNLYEEENRGKLFYSFEFASSFLNNRLFDGLLLDPDLTRYPERQFLPSDKAFFGFLSDSAPDKWGRTLINKKEIETAEKEKRPLKALTELDYLLRVADRARMGALRYKESLDGPFLAVEGGGGDPVPPFTKLRDLEEAARLLDAGEKVDDAVLDLLLGPGSSLGGARPKASVQSPDGSLWMAKFPSTHDDYDVASFEMIAHDLASMVGIRVPAAEIESFSQHGFTYLSQRFDRVSEKRIHFASALALLGRQDGEEASYLDLASFIRLFGSHPKDDLKELYRRLVFNIAIANTDDHLRNHGFLLDENGWRLAPAYDLNPNPFGRGLSLSIDGFDHSLDWGLALKVAGLFGLSKEEGRLLVEESREIIRSSISGLLRKYHIKNEEWNHLKPSFSRVFD